MTIHNPPAAINVVVLKRADKEMERRDKEMAKNKTVSPAKAKEILRDGTAHGKKLTKKQKGLFGVIASGKKLKKK